MDGHRPILSLGSRTLVEFTAAGIVLDGCEAAFLG
jgi:hypothetical protein